MAAGVAIVTWAATLMIMKASQNKEEKREFHFVGGYYDENGDFHAVGAIKG